MQAVADPLDLLVRAAVSQRLAACFRYPSADGSAALRRDLAAMSGQARGSHGLAALLERLALAFTGAGDETLQAEYSRLFLGAAASPLHETAYGPPRLTTAAELADVQGFYRAFGFELSDASRDMADHLGAELEFHAALLVKLAWAADRNLAEPLEITSRAAAAFLECHLGRWPPALAERLHATAPGSVYGRAAAEAAAFVRTECERFAVAPPPLAFRAGGAGPGAFTCPRAGECAHDA